MFNNRKPTCFEKDYKQSFVSAGARGKQKPSDARSRSLLDYANDWQLQVDFEDRKLVFPPNICATNLRPDIVISSAKTCNVILLELTCCAEEGIDAAQLRKETRYAELMTDIAAQGWTAQLFTLEVGARGKVCSTDVWRKHELSIFKIHLQLPIICIIQQRPRSCVRWFLFPAHVSTNKALLVIFFRNFTEASRVSIVEHRDDLLKD